jgi:hypothetical protein
MDDWKLPGKETAFPADPDSEPAVLVSQLPRVRLEARIIEP